MIYTRIITPVAQFSMDHLARKFRSRIQQREWARLYSRTWPGHRIEMTEEMFNMFALGPEDVQPRIWTHVPVPMGMDITAVHRQFERRAASVLGDHEAPVDFTPHPTFADGRYRSEGLRMAWMMYLDLAIEKFLADVQ